VVMEPRYREIGVYKPTLPRLDSFSIIICTAMFQKAESETSMGVAAAENTIPLLVCVCVFCPFAAKMPTTEKHYRIRHEITA
jgi:hypothetical protein